MIIVGICGASGSGKSTMARELRNALPCKTLVLGMDCYYKDHSHLPFAQRTHINYDAPDIFDYDELLSDITALEGGKPITRNAYDYTNHVRADTKELLQPPEVLILEGIHMFRDPRLCAKMALKLYMQVDPDVCLLRRVKRDLRARGRSIESVYAQYLETVKPMYDQYISKYIQKADFAVIGGGKNRLAIEAVRAYICALLPAQYPAPSAGAAGKG